MGLFDNFSYQNGNIVDKSWIKWYHFGVPDKEGPSREATRKWLKGLGQRKILERRIRTWKP
ncbi:MAG: hypothetical protein IKC56_00770 [Clostridia bacterium]|nr:hypothetical protein [Clostridia bacterium]